MVIILPPNDFEENAQTNADSNANRYVTHLRQEILEDGFCIGAQSLGECDLHADDEVTPFTGFPVVRHAPAWVVFLVAGLCGTRLGNADGFAINGTDDAFPAGQSFLETELDSSDEVVALDFEVWVIKLWGLLAVAYRQKHWGWGYLHLHISQSSAYPVGHLLLRLRYSGT